MPIEPTELRRVMGHFVTGVTVVTSLIDERPCAMTANSVASVSLNPPLVMFCADLSSETRRGIQQSKFFAINILDENHESISRALATKGPKNFEGIGYRTETTGAPILEDALAWMECTLYAEYEGGDHSIFLGTIERGDARPEGKPLVFYRGGYHSLEA